MDTEAVMAVLHRVLDPEHPVDIVEMGLVKPDDVTFNDNEILIEFTPTSPMCPMGAVIGIIIRKAIEDEFPNVKAIVHVKSGTHYQEAACNNMINDEAQYNSAIEKLTNSGALDRLIVKD